MQTGNFRQIVRDEIFSWFDKNPRKLDRIVSRIAELLTPAFQTEIAAGIMVRIGGLTPDERELAAMQLENAADYILRYAPARKDIIETTDLVVEDLKSAALQLRSAGSQPAKQTPTEGL
jgi:hypothetical protein